MFKHQKVYRLIIWELWGPFATKGLELSPHRKTKRNKTHSYTFEGSHFPYHLEFVFSVVERLMSKSRHEVVFFRRWSLYKPIYLYLRNFERVAEWVVGCNKKNSPLLILARF